MDSIVSFQHVSKTFGSKTAVNDLSFTVERGEIFGLLGPNGAGKTTTLRMLLGLLAPDDGDVHVFGGALDERKKDRIGYMPEERGLYSQMRVWDCLVYLARLKNLSTAQAHTRVENLLKRLELWEHRAKRIHQLSRGLAQKAQLAAALAHEPDLLIVDEPFANLDPVNVQLGQELVREWRAQGRSVILSSHQLHLVEMLCDRILLMQEGRAILYGSLREIQRAFAPNAVQVRGRGDFSKLPHVTAASENAGVWQLTLAAAVTPTEWLRQVALCNAVTLEHFQIAAMPLDEIFVRLVRGESAPTF
ncbi:MAG: ATP-binding cassette domain-containing protein [Chloroflexi bacterium]|nr:ATP-binding cassette domain-containing protein [Chloroflexota bacterium]